MSSWIELASTPYGSVLDATKMFWPVALPRKSHFRAAAKMRAVNLESESYRNIGLESANGAIPQERIGDVSISPVKIIVGADVEMSVTRTRVVTATALGIFASKLEERSMQYVVDPLSNALNSLSGVQRQVLLLLFKIDSICKFIISSLFFLFLFSHFNNSHSLQVASMVLISWFKEIKSMDTYDNQGTLPGFPNHLRNWLLDLLACSDPTFPTKESLLPYSELSRTYSKMRGEANQLLNAMESSGMFENMLATTKSELETLSADDAINLASKVPALCNDDVGNDNQGHLDGMESAKQRLLTTSGYLKCVQVLLRIDHSFVMHKIIYFVFAIEFLC